MVYNKYFITLVFFSSISGVIISLLNHNFERQIVKNSRENKGEDNGKVKTNEKEKGNEEEEDIDYESFEKTEFGEDINKIDIIKGKLRIATSYATDNRYVYPTLVAMTSLVENAGKNTYYDIYVMLHPEFKEEFKKILKSVEKNHYEHCSVIFINMGNKFKDQKTDNRISTPAYYRLELHNLLPNVNRIIWMDSDTMVFEDLTNLIKLDMKGKFMLGFLDSLPDAIKDFGIKDAIVLCSGVLLIDLDALRKNNITEKFNKFMKEKKDKIVQHDQTIINVVLQNYIGKTPPKYGIWAFENSRSAISYNRRQRLWLKYDINELLNAYHHPAILHFIWPKPFWRKREPVFNDKWWEYAKKTGYYNDIYYNSPSPKYDDFIDII